MTLDLARRACRRLFVPAVAGLALAVVLAGCGGAASTGAAGTVPGGVSSATPSDRATPSSAVPAHASSAAVTPIGSRSAVPGPSSSTATPSRSEAAVATRSPAPTSGVPLPPTGRFTYAVSGSSTTAFGTQKLDGKSTLTVSRTSSDTERTKQQDQGGTTQQTLLAQAGGLYLTDLHISQPGFDEDFHPKGMALLFPAHAVQGKQWAWSMTSTDGSYTLRATLTIADLHSSATAGDGHRVSTVAIASVLHIDSSDIHLVTHQRDEAAHDAMIVRERTVTDGTAYGTKLHSDATRVLSHA